MFSTGHRIQDISHILSVSMQSQLVYVCFLTSTRISLLLNTQFSSGKVSHRFSKVLSLSLKKKHRFQHSLNELALPKDGSKSFSTKALNWLYKILLRNEIKTRFQESGYFIVTQII